MSTKVQPNTKSLTDLVCNNLVSKQKVDKVVAFDPTIIMVIIQIIQMLMEQMKNCNLFTPVPPTPTNKTPNIPALAVCHNPNILHRFLLKRIVMKSGVSTKVEANKVYAAMLDAGKSVTNAQLIGAEAELDFDLI